MTYAPFGAVRGGWSGAHHRLKVLARLTIGEVFEV